MVTLIYDNLNSYYIPDTVSGQYISSYNLDLKVRLLVIWLWVINSRMLLISLTCIMILECCGSGIIYNARNICYSIFQALYLRRLSAESVFFITFYSKTPIYRPPFYRKSRYTANPDTIYRGYPLPQIGLSAYHVQCKQKTLFYCEPRFTADVSFPQTPR